MSQLPRFFYNGQLAEKSIVSLDAEAAKHIWQVLRMQAEDRIILTDGYGASAEGTIHTAERHKCNVTVEKVSHHVRPGNILHLGVGFTKSNSRNEWLLEKATELGVASIIPLVAFRSEKTHVRDDRWNRILQSAILQSKQYYLPLLADVTPLHIALEKFKDVPQKFIAHCMSEKEKSPLAEMLKPGVETILLIGPEGDFTQEEVNLCMEYGFKPVSLGSQRMRTETAAITVAAYFNVINNGKI
jgi:16S rRNA (uracil1498-N3)-methyltransferase